MAQAAMCAMAHKHPQSLYLCGFQSKGVTIVTLTVYGFESRMRCRVELTKTALCVKCVTEHEKWTR